MSMATPTSGRRRGGRPALERGRITFVVRTCSLGSVLLATTPHGLCCVLLGDDDRALRDELALRFPRVACVEGDEAFAAAMTDVVAVVDGRRPAAQLSLPLDLHGTAFQRLVWRALCDLEVGEVVDYAGLARRIGRPTAVRAVARACAHNPVAVVVPCHRVVRKDGALAGYRWGLAHKRALLARERLVDVAAG